MLTGDRSKILPSYSSMSTISKQVCLPVLQHCTSTFTSSAHTKAGHSCPSSIPTLTCSFTHGRSWDRSLHLTPKKNTSKPTGLTCPTTSPSVIPTNCLASPHPTKVGRRREGGGKDRNERRNAGRNGQVPTPNKANSQPRNPRGQNVCSGGCGRERCS